MAASVLGGCPSEPGPCPGPGSVEVGQGGNRLSPLRDGDSLPIVQGAQGGVHVLVGFWARGLSLDVDATYQLTDRDSGAGVGTPTERRLRPGLYSQVTETEAVRNPDLVVLDNGDPTGDVFDGRWVRLQLDVRTLDGTAHACDAREVRLELP